MRLFNRIMCLFCLLDFTTNSRLQEESAVLNHKNSILSTKINNYIFESNKVQREIVVPLTQY